MFEQNGDTPYDKDAMQRLFDAGRLGENNVAQNSSASNRHFSLFTAYDVDLFKAGRHYQLYNKFGSKAVSHQGVDGVYFSVWAPSAARVSVIGNFNGWNRQSHAMHVRWDGSGIWELFVPELKSGELYKYFIRSHDGVESEKGDPYAHRWETAPATASVVWDLDYQWTDRDWLKRRGEQHALTQPLSVYEVHLGSWRKTLDNKFLTYRELAAELPAYCNEMGFTHVELMPVMEHPFFGSWGYQITGFFAPTSRFGSPQDFMFLVNELHNAGIGVILDWVPSHFPDDAHGLHRFDGSALYEHPDPRKGFHPDWNSFIFNYGRNEVRSFLVSNALFWCEKFHADGLRVDAVASMLYLDYSRRHGEWEPNEYGGRENLDAIHFLQEFNDAVHAFHPDVITVAEESTAYPGVTHPVDGSGLGFDMKWMMGWMHDTLTYFSKNPLYRSHHQFELIFSIVYAFSEKFMLPLSHDEVVYGKGSLINKMPGDEWQQFANLRLLYAYMYGHPGAKMIFQGGEFAQRHEWKHDYSLDWHHLENRFHQGVQSALKDLNALYKTEPALYQHQFAWEGFEWIDFLDTHNSVISWLRKGESREDDLLFVANFTPVVHRNYRIGVPQRGTYLEIFNSDNGKYNGSDVRNENALTATPIPKHNKTHSLSLTLPPLGLFVLKLAKE
ncbi:MAG TPA: 1,4-alpha-glucan branching protein GlgB [Chitinophagales bacterium]|nr:1,4-alpha-glucan branching protein GlgB [Chitinophagales bacterium]